MFVSETDRGASGLESCISSTVDECTDNTTTAEQEKMQSSIVSKLESYCVAVDTSTSKRAFSEHLVTVSVSLSAYLLS